MLLLWLALAVWIGLLLFRGGFWRADQRLCPGPEPHAGWPGVAVVIPARNEAASIGAVLDAHARSRYPGEMTIVMVDDDSTDGTGQIARHAAARTSREIIAVDAPPLEPGWSGKLWALAAGIAEAERRMPEARYLLLTDADIRHAPGTLGDLVAKAEAEGLVLISLMARLDAAGAWARLLIPAFVFFFQKLYPFPWVNDPARMTAGAAGGCMLVRRDALAAIGGIAAIRGALIDDCTLAARLKAGPPRRAIWLGLAEHEVVSLRDNAALGSIWKMVARTAFTQLRQSWLLLAGAVMGMALVYLAAPMAVLALPVYQSLPAFIMGTIVWALMLVAYRPTAALYGQPWWWGLTLPLAAAFYTLMTLDSARRHFAGRGGAWKGRTYP